MQIADSAYIVHLNIYIFFLYEWKKYLITNFFFFFLEEIVKQGNWYTVAGRQNQISVSGSFLLYQMQQLCSERDVSTFCPNQVYFHTFSSCNGPQSIGARLPVYRLSVQGSVKRTQKSFRCWHCSVHLQVPSCTCLCSNAAFWHKQGIYCGCIWGHCHPHKATGFN